MTVVPTIYHGTPMTPRAALNAVMPGRAACVSFFRPDDLEAVLAVCPQVMFRPRSLFLLDAGHACGARVGRVRPSGMVARILPVARADAVPTGAVGDYAGQPGGAISAQRRASERLAVWPVEGRASLAHGWADRASCSHVRQVRPRLHRLDRASEARACRVRRIPTKDGRGRSSHGECLAPPTHAARDQGRVRLSVHLCGQHVARAERPSL